MENQQEQKMRLKFVFAATWPNANRIQKYGGRGFEETDIHMVLYMLLFRFYISTAFFTD